MKDRIKYILGENFRVITVCSNHVVITLLLMFRSLLLNAQQTNILLIISDDLNTCIGPYMDIDNHTPQLDRLANEGVRFSRAYCQYPLCGPSRASLMSGLYPETNGVLDNDDEPGSYKKETPWLADHPSLAGFFREQGYFTARVSKIFHMGVPGQIQRGEPGGDEPDSWDYAYNVMGPETLSPGKLEILSPGNTFFTSMMILPDALKTTQTDYIATSQAIAILENRAGTDYEYGRKTRQKKDAPFFLAVGFVRPHFPHIAPENCFVPYPENEIILPPVKTGDNVPEQALRRHNDKILGMNELQKRKIISAYMASVRFMDQQVGRLLDALDRLDLRKNTIVVFISDHGYNLGEHDCWGKHSLWEGSIRAPMIISVPGQEKNFGTTCDHIIEQIDLYPTLTELCGFVSETPNILQGESIASYLKGYKMAKKKNYAYTVSYQGRDASLRTDKWRYTRWGKEAMPENEELYDHKNDPEEYVNLADNPDYKNVLEEMREKFELAKREAITKNFR